MNIDEALKILGLPQVTTLEEIDSQYQELAKNNHPDLGGENDNMQQLNVARDIVRASIKNQALVPLNAVQDLVKNSVTSILQQQVVREEITSITQKMKQTSSNSIKWMKDFAILMGAITAILIFAGKEILPKDLGGTNSTFGVLLLTMTIFTGILYWYSNESIRRLENNIEDLKQYLNQKSRYIELFSQIFPQWKIKKWTYTELEDDEDIDYFSSSEVLINQICSDEPFEYQLCINKSSHFHDVQIET